jgi:hypothetical protein
LVKTWALYQEGNMAEMSHQPAQHTTVWRSLLLTLLILGLFYYWFVRVDRSVIFLYGHSGATPFDAATTSRYWMSGLVVAGVVLLCDAVGNWFVGRIRGVFYRHYRVAAWQRVWWGCAPWVSAGILVITMLLGKPPLPLEAALLCVAFTLAGVALALPFSSLAADQPAELGWSLLYGVGFMPPLLLLRFIESPGTQPANGTLYMVLGSLVVSGG